MEETKRHWIWDVLYICYVLYLIYYLFKDIPLEAKMWRFFAKDWQRLGRFWGQAGLDAENEYYKAIRRVSLA